MLQRSLIVERSVSFGRTGSIAAILLLAGCGDTTIDLPYDSGEFVWRYEAQAPIWDSKAATNVDKFTVFTVGDRVFAVEWSRAKSGANRVARILGIDGDGKSRKAAPVGQPIKFGSSGLSDIFPVRRKDKDTRRLVVARTTRDSETRRLQQRISVATITGNPASIGERDAVTIGSLAFVNSAWRGPNGTVLLAGADSDGAYRTLRLVLLDENGAPKWSYLASDLPGKRTTLRPTVPIAVQWNADGSLVLTGSDGRWSGDDAVRYIYRLSLSASGKRVGFRSLFDIPASDLSSGAIQGRRVRARPHLTDARRMDDGSITGLLGGWYKNERRALRVIKLSAQGKITWIQTLASDEKAARDLLGIARNDEILVFGMVDDQRRFFRLSPAGKRLATYILPDLRIEHIQPHPKRGYLLTAIRTEQDGTRRLAILHFVPK